MFAVAIQYLEDIEQTCNVCDAGYNDPLNVFSTTKEVAKTQRQFLEACQSSSPYRE
jgi:hypothetical protein